MFGHLFYVDRWILVFTLLLTLPSGHGRIHKLKIENDWRTKIDVTTFGFLNKGHLAVNITNFGYASKDSSKKLNGVDNRTFGFTLDKTVSTGISPYLNNKQEECILRDKTVKKDQSVSVIFFYMDFKKKSIFIERKGEDFKNLKILHLSEVDFRIHHRGKRSAPVQPPHFYSDPFSDSSLMRHRRHASIEKRSDKTESKKAKAAGDPNKIKKLKDVEKEKQIKSNKTPKSKAPSTKTKSKAPTTKVPVPVRTTSPDMPLFVVHNNFTMEVDNEGRYSAYFVVMLDDPRQEGLYNFVFHNCGNFENSKSVVNFTAYIVEDNDGNYLSAGRIPLPPLYFTLSVVFFVAGCLWLYVLRRATQGVFKIHYLMLVLIYVKSIALLFHAVNYHFIQREGHHEEAFAILYYITHLMKGALLFITIVLIGAGWAFIKHMLSDRDKKIFLIVIPLQVLANVAQIIIEETEEGQSNYTLWKEIFILVDLLCCGAILFPVVWSIRHLQEASQTDGKAAINLQKLKIFRHFYIMIVCYIYFTRIIVYLLNITVPFVYEWLDELFKEVATFIFFMVTGYKFLPASDNPYLQVPQDSDEEIEMDEVVTQSGVYENVVKVNVKSKKTDGEASSMPNKRESSHEYD